MAHFEIAYGLLFNIRRCLVLIRGGRLLLLLGGLALFAFAHFWKKR